jgi:hypothetical protein
MMAAVMMGASVERAAAQPKGLLVPHGLLVNHDRIGLRLGFMNIRHRVSARAMIAMTRAEIPRIIL